VERISEGYLTRRAGLPFVFPFGAGGKMPLFKVGDYVERVGTLISEYMKFGRIIRVSQLRLAAAPSPSTENPSR
jgi:hypothetical protein